MIKYKGHTTNLLSDLSLELGHAVDLKQSENVLGNFFHYVLKEISIEKNIELLSLLPAFIKPFCQKQPDQPATLAKTESKVTQAVLRVLSKYIPAEKLQSVYACFPSSIWASPAQPVKNLCLAA